MKMTLLNNPELNNKVNLFLLKFFNRKKLLTYFSLIIFILFSNSAQSQFKERYDSLFSLYHSSKLKDDTLKVRLLYDLAVYTARTGIQGFKTKNYEVKEPGSYYTEALTLSVKLNYENGIELFYSTLASIFNQKTDIPVIGFKEPDDGISSKNFKELHYYRKKKHFGSLDTYIREMEMLKKQGITEKNYQLEFWIGLIYFDWGNFRKAIGHFRNSCQYSTIKSDKAILGNVYQCLGVSYFYYGNNDSSIYYFNKFLEISDNQIETGICLVNLGEVYANNLDFTTASLKFKEAVKYFSATTDSIFLVFALNELGKSYINLNSIKSAEKVLFLAFQIIKGLNDKFLLVDFYKNMAGLYEAKGHFQKAFYYQKKYQQLKDSLLVNEVSLYFQYYEDNWQNAIGREISKKESEALKKGETTIALNKSRIILLFMGVFILTVLLISTYTYRLYRLKQKAYVYLTELNKSKEKLLSIISHDVRGPIIGLIDLLEPLNQQINNLSKGQISGHINKIIEFAHHIKLLLDNMLEWTKAQQGMIVYRPEIFTLSEAIEPNMDIYSQLAKSKEINLKCCIQEELKIFADRNMIEVVLRNLINNAVKFTGKGGTILLESEVNTDCITVSVSDTGIGLSEEIMATLFTENQQINNDKFRLNKRSGLGLVLCKEYIACCGGKIWATSKGINSGSEFFFTVKQADNNEQN